MADSNKKKTQTGKKKLSMDAIDPATASSWALMQSIAQQGPRASMGLPLSFRGSEVPPGNQFKIQFAAYRRTVQDDLDAMDVRHNKDLPEFQADFDSNILDILTAKFNAKATSMSSPITPDPLAMPHLSSWYSPQSVSVQEKPLPFSFACAVPPTNSQQLQSFLGLANYFCHFMDSYAEVSKPLHMLMTETNKLDMLDEASGRPRMHFPSRRLTEWTEQHQHAFEAIKEQLTAPMPKKG